MIFLDAETPIGPVVIVAETQGEVVSALLDRLEVETVDLQDLAAACLGCQALDVMVLGG